MELEPKAPSTPAEAGASPAEPDTDQPGGEGEIDIDEALRAHLNKAAPPEAPAADAPAPKPDQPPAKPEDGSPPADGRKVVENPELTIYGRKQPVQVRIEGKPAEVDAVVAMLQKSVAATQAFADAAAMRRSVEAFLPVVERMERDPLYAQRVMGLLRDQPGQPPAPAAPQAEGQFDPELEAELQKSPTLRKALEANKALQEQLDQLTGRLASQFETDEATAQLEGSVGQIEALGFDGDEFLEYLHSLQPKVLELAASPDPRHRQAAERLNNDPQAWSQAFLAAKAKGWKGRASKPAPATVPAKPAPRVAPGRDASAARPSSGPDDWKNLTQRAFKSGAEADFDKALAARIVIR